MTDSETDIMRHFRYYLAGEGEMVFFNMGAEPRPAGFDRAIAALISDGMVVKERPRNAYSLTRQGYQASMTIRPMKDRKRAVSKPCRLNTDP